MQQKFIWELHRIEPKPNIHFSVAGNNPTRTEPWHLVEPKQNQTQTVTVLSHLNLQLHLGRATLAKLRQRQEAKLSLG